MERLAASTASFCTPVMPQNCTFPARSARCAWMIATSGLTADTAVSCSPVNGQVICLIVSVWVASPVPLYPRSTANGSPAAPATYRLAIPAWLCSSISSGCGQPCSTASLNRCSEPTPGFPPQEKTSLRAQPAPISWS